MCGNGETPVVKGGVIGLRWRTRNTKDAVKNFLLELANSESSVLLMSHGNPIGMRYISLFDFH